METVPEMDVVRALSAQACALGLLRDDGDSPDVMPILEVRFSPFNAWYEVASFWEGNFMERTVKGAFARTMDNARSAPVMPVKMLYDHGHDPSIGNKPLAAVEDLREAKDSAVASGRLFDAAYVRELLPGLEAGVYGSSFRFRVIQDSWNDEPDVSDHNPKGIPERTITEIRLFEQGPVTFPASPTASAGLRSVSMTDAYYESLRNRSPAYVDALSERARGIQGLNIFTGTLVGSAPAFSIAVRSGLANLPADSNSVHSGRAITKAFGRLFRRTDNDA
jgi:hypothetical protein